MSWFLSPRRKADVKSPNLVCTRFFKDQDENNYLCLLWAYTDFSSINWFTVTFYMQKNKKRKQRKRTSATSLSPPPCLETIETKPKVQPRTSSLGYLWLISMETFHFLLKGKSLRSDKWPQSDGLWHLWEEFKEQKQCRAFLLYVFLFHFCFTPFMPILFRYNYSFSLRAVLSNKILNLWKKVILCLQTRVYSLWYPI